MATEHFSKILVIVPSYMSEFKFEKLKFDNKMKNRIDVARP